MADMKSIIVLTCLCLIGMSRVYGASKKVMDFISFFSGDFDNKAQTKKPGDKHDFVRTRVKQVDIKCLPMNPVIFGEEDVKDDIRVMFLAVVTDGREDTVIVNMYNFTDNTKYKPREFNTDSLVNTSCEDLKGHTDCIAAYRVTNRSQVYGKVPLCTITNIIEGDHPRFTTIHTCTNFSSTMSVYLQETATIEPYEMELTFKHPLINKPPDYVSPCGN